MSVELEMSERMVVSELWSPHELHTLKAEVNILSSSQKTFEVKRERYNQLRPSLLVAPFELLHHYWRFTPECQTNGTINTCDSCINAPISCECTRISYTLVPCNESTHSESSRSSNINVNTINDITHGVNNCNVDKAIVADSVIAEQSKMTGCFMFTTVYPHTTFITFRSPVHLMTFLAALSYSFPHFIIPADNVSSVTLAQTLCEFLQSHRRFLQTYLPYLYFCFEMNESKAVNFFKTLETLVRQNKLYENSLFEHLKPAKTSSWLSWGASKPKIVIDDEKIVDTDEFVAQHKAELCASCKCEYPSIIERRKLFAQVRKELLKAENLMQNATCRETVMQQGTKVSVSDESAVGCSSTIDSDAINDIDDSQIEYELKKYVNSLLSTEAISYQHKQLPVVKHTLERITLWLESIYFYLLEYLRIKQNIFSSDDYVSQIRPLPKTCAAATSPALFDEIIKLYCACTRTLLITEQHMQDEIDAVKVAVRQLELQLAKEIHFANTEETKDVNCTNVKVHKENVDKAVIEQNDDKLNLSITTQSCSEWEQDKEGKRNLSEEDELEDSVCTDNLSVTKNNIRQQNEEREHAFVFATKEQYLYLAYSLFAQQLTSFTNEVK